jgi:hypothetical protein
VVRSLRAGHFRTVFFEFEAKQFEKHGLVAIPGFLPVTSLELNNGCFPLFASAWLRLSSIDFTPIQHPTPF